MNIQGQRTNQSTLRLSVLKAPASFKEIRRAFIKPERGYGYEFVVLMDASIRKYKQSTDHLDRTLQNAQWRSNHTYPLVHCIYVQLLSPSAHSRGVKIEVYLQDIEVPIHKLKKLLLQEALYLVYESLQGYQVLFDRFKAVSVNQQTFGLNAKGECVSWINRQLQLDHCEDDCFKNQGDIIEAILRIVKTKSEPICQSFMSKIDDYLIKRKERQPHRKITFEQMFCYLGNFIKTHQVKMPQNLKYLVNQQRLTNNLEEFRSHKNLSGSVQKLTEEWKQTAYLPLRATFKENGYKSPFQVKKMKKPRISYNVISTLRRTLGQRQNLLMTCRSLNARSKNLSFSSKGDEQASLQFETIRKFHDSQISRQDHSRSDLSQKQHSRCKSQSYENIQIVNLLGKSKHLQTTRSINKNCKQFKRYSGISDNAKTAGSFFQHSKLTTEESMIEAETVKKINRKSSINQFPGRILQNFRDAQQFQSHQVSPYIYRQGNENTPKISLTSPLQSANPTFHVIPEYQAQQIIKTNQWTTTLRNLLNVESKLNTSITQGQDTNNYLSDVRLQKLDGLSKQMVISLIPQGSEHSIQCLQSKKQFQ